MGQRPDFAFQVDLAVSKLRNFIFPFPGEQTNFQKRPLEPANLIGQLGVPPHIKDKLLHHTPPRTAGEGYDHYDYLPEQRESIEKWADRVVSIVWPENVRALHG